MPFGAPVSRSVTTLTFDTVPHSPKNSQRSSSSTSGLSEPTNTPKQPSGFSPGPDLPLPLPLSPLPLPFSSRGALNLTKMSLPLRFVPDLATALSVDSISSKSTKAMPRGAPVSRSVSTFTFDTVPHSPKNSHKSSSSTSGLSDPTKTPRQPSGFSPGPDLPLPLPSLPLPLPLSPFSSRGALNLTKTALPLSSVSFSATALS